MSDSNIFPAKFRFPLNPQSDFRDWFNGMVAAAEEWERSAQHLSEESNKMEEAINNLLKDKEESDNLFRTISHNAKTTDPTKCMGNKQPICQRCNRLTFDGGIMIPEAKLGKCKNFQNKKR